MKAVTKKSSKKKYYSAIDTLVSREHNINTYMEGSVFMKGTWN